jgi:hypothetical protein
VTEIISKPKKLGIATIANDKVYDWLLPFLESWSATNSGTPLYVIPYDDRCDRTRQACAVFGAHFVEPDHKALDALAHRLYPLFPKHRRRLRKFLSLALPLDEVIYVDVDIVLFRDFSPLFGRLDKGVQDFVVAAPTTDYVYNKKRELQPFLKDVMLFNDGFFLTSNTILSLDDFYTIIERDEAIFHSVRQRGMLFAQPLTNFVTHRKGLKIVSLNELISKVSGESFYKADGVTFDGENKPLDVRGDEIYFAHWAGAVALPKRRVFDAAWLRFSATAVAKMKASESKWA